MCKHCEGGSSRRIDVTDETVGDMIHETTTVALQAAASCANGWFEAAKGYLSDMSAVWGGPGVGRMVYVWGSGRFFLPGPPGHSTALGSQETAELVRRMTGEEPDSDEVARLVAKGDQLAAACDAIATAVSKGDLTAVTQAMDSFATSQCNTNSLLLTLMADCGLRLRHSRDAGDEMAHDLFMAHVRADLFDGAEYGGGGETEGEESGGGTV